MTHPDYIRQKAIRMRLESKLTIDEIAERLAVSRTTAYYWVKDIPIPKTRKQTAARQRASAANRDQARRKREAAYAEGVGMFPGLIKEPTFRDFICMYIGEGYKRTRHNVSLCNSNPAVVKLAQTWIVRFSRNPVTYSIQYHADQSLDELRDFWSVRLGIGRHEIQFQRKSNSNQLSGRTWRSKHGVLNVRCGDTYFKAKLDAWIELVLADWG